jgi:hypothetical protein
VNADIIIVSMTVDFRRKYSLVKIAKTGWFIFNTIASRLSGWGGIVRRN